MPSLRKEAEATALVQRTLPPNAPASHRNTMPCWKGSSSAIMVAPSYSKASGV